MPCSGRARGLPAQTAGTGRPKSRLAMKRRTEAVVFHGERGQMCVVDKVSTGAGFGEQSGKHIGVSRGRIQHDRGWLGEPLSDNPGSVGDVERP